MKSVIKMKIQQRTFKISEICDVIKGKTPTMKAVPGKYPLVVTAENRKTCENYQFDCEAVCVPLVSSTGHGHADMRRIHYQNGKFALANIMVAIIPKDDKIVFPKYLYYLLYAKKEEYFVSLMRGTSNVSLKTPQIENVMISLPPINEQKMIVLKIDKFVLELNNVKQLLEDDKIQLEQYRKSFHITIFERIIPKSNEELPKGWKYVKLENIVKKEMHSIKRGPFGSHLKKEIFVKSGYKVYEQKNAIYNDFNLGKYYIDEKKFQEMKNFELKSGDIIISCSGTIGKLAVVPDTFQSGIINQALLKITIDTNIMFIEFFLYLFKFWMLKLEVESHGSSMGNLSSVKALKKIPILLPSLPEQKKIILQIERGFSIIDKSDFLLNSILKDLEMMQISALNRHFQGN